MNITIGPIFLRPKWSWPKFKKYNSCYGWRRYIEVELGRYRLEIHRRYPAWNSHTCSAVFHLVTHGGEQYRLGRPYCQDGRWHCGHGQWRK